MTNRPRQLRREQALARVPKLPQAQLDALNDRLGVGVGAIKERDRLEKLL